MATRKAKCLKRGKRNKCLKRVKTGSKARKGGLKRRCRTAKGQFKKC